MAEYRNCDECGEQFTPRWKSQITCRRCKEYVPCPNMCGGLMAPTCKTVCRSCRDASRNLICQVSGCPRPTDGQTYCIMHANRLLKTGSVGPAQPLRRDHRTAGDRRWKDKRGYVYTTVQGKAVAEHRQVMAEHLDRELQPWENVHHKNGDRADNRLENLELWIRPQPTGQRPEDLAEWVVQHYPELVERAQREFQLKLAI